MEMKEPDYLDHLIESSLKERPGFSEIWAPYAQMFALADERIRLGLSQQEVANRMGVDRAAVSRMESAPGRVAFERILRYIHALGTELVFKPSTEKTKEPKGGRGRKVGEGSKARRAA